MKNLTQILLGIFIVLSCAAWSQKAQNCASCETVENLLSEITEKQEDFIAKQEFHKKHLIQDENTPERRAFELAQGKAYRFVCDDGKTTRNNLEKKALTELVLGLNRLGIDSDAMFEINGCFRAKVLQSRKQYTAIARTLGVEGELHQLIVMNTPTDQDFN